METKSNVGSKSTSKCVEFRIDTILRKMLVGCKCAFLHFMMAYILFKYLGVCDLKTAVNSFFLTSVNGAGVVVTRIVEKE